jgi:hypothetical protein
MRSVVRLEGGEQERGRVGGERRGDGKPSPRKPLTLGDAQGHRHRHHHRHIQIYETTEDRGERENGGEGHHPGGFLRDQEPRQSAEHAQAIGDGGARDHEGEGEKRSGRRRRGWQDPPEIQDEGCDQEAGAGAP